MKIKTSELIGPALDWAVAKCEGYSPLNHSHLATVMVERKNARGVMQPEHITNLRFSTEWWSGGPIIERERIEVRPGEKNEGWFASIHSAWMFMPGPTALIATMRVFVAAKLGDEVEIPEELLR